jgi:hypothetical protein
VEETTTPFWLSCDELFKGLTRDRGKACSLPWPFILMPLSLLGSCSTLPSNSSPPPADHHPDPIAVSTNAVDEEDISDEETVLTRGSNGPHPSKLLNQPIARDLTLKILFQSTEELSTREVAGLFLNLHHAAVSMKAAMPKVVYDNNKQLSEISVKTAPPALRNSLRLTKFGQITSIGSLIATGRSSN